VPRISYFRGIAIYMYWDEGSHATPHFHAGDVDFSSMQWKGIFEPVHDPTYFAKVRVDTEAATVVWPNGADLAPETLYDEARKNPLIAA